MKTTLGNQLSAFAASSIAKSNNTLKTQGESLSTGMKKDISVVDSYMGNRLNDEALISKTVLNNMAFGKHITSVAAADMEIAATAIRDAINITAQAGNDNSLDALTSMFNKTIEHYDALIAKSNFNGIKLLDGTLGQDAAIRSKFKTKTVDTTQPAGHARFAVAGTKSLDTITVGENITAGDSITLAGVKFTAVQGEPKKEGEFSVVTAKPRETRDNLVKAITNHSSESLQGYTVESNGAAGIRINSITAKAGNIPCIAPSANITRLPTTPGIQGGIDVSGIKDLDAFIGTIPSLKEEAMITGAVTTKPMAIAYGNAAAIASGAGANGGDIFVVYSTEIGGKKFEGSLYQPNTGNLNSQELVMVADKGTANEQRFVIKFAAADAGQLNAGTLNDINAFVQGCKFTQTKSLKINTDKGDIFYQGKVIGSTKGVRAQLTASDFKNLNFEDFKVEVSDVVNRVFKAVIGGKEYVSTPAAANTFVAGSRVTLTNTETGNVLAINLGDKGLTGGLNPTQFDTIAKEFKDMFMNKGDGLEVSVGVNVADKIKINMANLSKEKIFVDDQGNYVEKLSLDRNDIGKTIQALNNALKTLRSNQSMLTAEQKNIETGAEKLRRNIDVTQEAADSYRKADLTEAAEEFASNFKMLMTAISMIQAGQKVADTVLRIVQGVAQ